MRLRDLLHFLRRTPLHPQWLLNDRKALSAWIKYHAQGVVLDIGCADRWIEQHLPHGSHYIGLDHWETGGKLYGSRPTVFADAACLPLATASCDTVILLEVLEHIKMPQDALREIARVLRPGGHLLLSMPFLYPIHDAPHDYQRLTRHGLQRDLANAGLEASSVEERLSSIETAVLLACLALGASVVQSGKRAKRAFILAPAFLMLIPVFNVFGWIAGRVSPNWTAMTSGFRVLARKLPDSVAG